MNGSRTTPRLFLSLAERGRAMNRQSEHTEQDEQILFEGVHPITLADRLTVLAALPMLPKGNPTDIQKSCDHGLFDEVGRVQIDLPDLINPTT